MLILVLLNTVFIVLLAIRIHYLFKFIMEEKGKEQIETIKSIGDLLKDMTKQTYKDLNNINEKVNKMKRDIK